ncbi:MAG: DUF4157 domain-containing protein [Winogradskyella sp.]|nr:MAG: DUF4157 domain-containing protein [Winogradskyella sp.]
MHDIKHSKDNNLVSPNYKESGSKKSIYLEDNRTVTQKKNNTGLPNNLKNGIENLSGIDMSDTKVHYNSSKPAQLNAHAYAQGTDIHLASGQEKHLPHEAWHVVQQKQGRVKPTMQMKGKVNINDDEGLEKEADVMGTKALQSGRYHKAKSIQRKSINSQGENGTIQRLTDPNHDWAKILNVYNRYHTDYLKFRPGGAPPGNLDEWTKNAAIAEARELSEWHGIKHLLTKNLAASFGSDKTTEPDAFSGKNAGANILAPQTIHHAVEHKYISGAQDQVAEKIKEAINQLTKKKKPPKVSRAPNIRESATAIITVMPGSEAATWIAAGGNPTHWDNKLKGGMKSLKTIHHANLADCPTSLSLIIQIEGKVPVFSKSINQADVIIHTGTASAVPISNAHTVTEATNIAIANTHTIAAHSHTAAGDHTNAAQSHVAAAQYYTIGGDHSNAAQSYTAVGDHANAAQSYSAAGDHANAARSHTIVANTHTITAHSHTAAGDHANAAQSYSAAAQAFENARVSHNNANEGLLAAISNGNKNISYAMAGHSHTVRANTFAAANNYAAAAQSHTYAAQSYSAASNHAAAVQSQAAAIAAGLH